MIALVVALLVVGCLSVVALGVIGIGMIYSGLSGLKLYVMATTFAVSIAAIGYGVYCGVNWLVKE